jgi:hypothetical protein
MHRAWLGSIALVVCFAARSASAFHAGATYDKPAGAGGGGGVFYTGAARERGWDCSACHTKAAHQIQVRLGATPDLLTDFAYVPGQTYSFTATLEGEHLGKQSSTANYNGLAIAFVDSKGNDAGTLSGYSPDDFYSPSAATITSAGTRVGVTRWTFRWTAPAKGSGPVTLHAAAVDGNAAGQSSGTLTDPWGDDVFVGKLLLKEKP